MITNITRPTGRCVQRPPFAIADEHVLVLLNAAGSVIDNLFSNPVMQHWIIRVEAFSQSMPLLLAVTVLICGRNRDTRRTTNGAEQVKNTRPCHRLLFWHVIYASVDRVERSNLNPCPESYLASRSRRYRFPWSTRS